MSEDLFVVQETEHLLCFAHNGNTLKPNCPTGAEVAPVRQLGCIWIPLRKLLIPGLGRPAKALIMPVCHTETDKKSLDHKRGILGSFQFFS